MSHGPFIVDQAGLSGKFDVTVSLKAQETDRRDALREAMKSARAQTREDEDSSANTEASARLSACSSTSSPCRSYRFRALLHFTTTAVSVEYFRARRVSAASPGARNVRWSRSAHPRQRAPRSPARTIIACRPRSSPQSSQRDSRVEMKTRRSREAPSLATGSDVTISPGSDR